MLHDVTELRRLERVRQDFVANVSHEFKTPLTAIQGFAETLLAGALDDPSNNRRFLGNHPRPCARLARLTDDLLKLARIEAGKLEVEFLPVGLMELIEALRGNHSAQSQPQTDRTRDRSSRRNFPLVRGDAGLLRDVLQNLLDNAIQYTPQGGRIRVSADAGAREVVVTVADTGIGIPLADRSESSSASIAWMLRVRAKPAAPAGPFHRETHRRSPRRPPVGGKRSRRGARGFLSQSPSRSVSPHIPLS